MRTENSCLIEFLCSTSVGAYNGGHERAVGVERDVHDGRARESKRRVDIVAQRERVEHTQGAVLEANHEVLAARVECARRQAAALLEAICPAQVRELIDRILACHRFAYCVL